jgi:hypothetical protein
MYVYILYVRDDRLLIRKHTFSITYINRPLTYIKDIYSVLYGMTLRSDLPITNTHLRTSLQTGMVTVVSEDYSVRRRLDERIKKLLRSRKKFVQICL